MNEKQTIKTLEAFFQSANWRVEKAEEGSIFRLVVPVGNEQFVSYALLYDDNFMFYPMAPLTVPPQQFPDVAEYTIRINNQLWTHNFELDYETGQVRCKGGFAFRNMAFDIQLVENVIHNTIDAMLHYMPGLAEVATGTKSAAVAASDYMPGQSNASPKDDEKAQDFYNVVSQFFEDEDWEYEQHYDAVSRIVYNGRNRDSYFTYLTMLAPVKKFFLSVGLCGIPEPKSITAVIEWMTRINYRLRLGYFNYDFEQNYLSFVNGIDFYGIMPTSSLLRNVVYPALTTADENWLYLNEVVTGAMSSQEGILPD